MLKLAVDQKVVSQAEADIFDMVHTTMDEYLVGEVVSGMDTGPRADALPQILAVMTESALLTQEQAEVFMDVHDRLIEAGLMQ
jgi:hypothetical protein